MSPISANSSSPSSHTGGNAPTYGLGAAFVAVLVTGVLLMWRMDEKWIHVRDRMDAWTEAAETSGELGPALAEIYATGIEPSGVEEAGSSRTQNARKAYEEKFAVVAQRVRSLSVVDDREAVLKELDEIQKGAQGMLGIVDTLHGPGQPRPADSAAGSWPRETLRAMESGYREAAEALQRLQRHERNIATDLDRERMSLTAGYHRIIYGMLAALLLVFIAGVVAFNRRSRQERENAAEAARWQEQQHEMEEKYRSLFDNAIEGVFQTTPGGRFLTANRALARMYGYDSPEQLMETLTDVGTQLYVDPSQRQALLEALQVEDVVSNYEFEVVRADGRLMWVRENVRAVRDESGELLYLEGTVEDVSDYWWGEQRRRLQFALGRVLGDSATVDQARPQILSTVCKALGWDAGIFWGVTEGGLRALEMWHVADLETGELELALPHLVYQRGHKLVGEVLVSGEPQWIADLASEPAYANADLLLACGMASAFAVPVSVNGEVQHVLEFFSPRLTLPDPELVQALGSISSQLGHLIERKRAEEALRKSEMRKAAILRSALDCIITFDLDGRITEFNPAAERTFGYTQQEALGREMAELIIPETLREGHRRGIALYNATTIGSMPGRRMELTAMRADGSEFPIELSISRILIDGKAMFTGYIRDITERQEAERITSELAAVVANSNDAIIACTLEGKIVSWNVGAERVYGYSSEEAIGRQLDMLIPPDCLDEFPQALSMVKRGESLANYETVRLRKDGKRISVSLTDCGIL